MKNKCIQLTTLSPPGTVDFNRVNARCRKCFPVTKEFREQLNNAVIDAYHQVLTQSQGQNQQKAEASPFEQTPEQRSGMQMARL